MNLHRRTLITLASAGLLQPLLAFAQQDPRVRRIGLLFHGSRESFGGARGTARFEQEMRDRGYGVGTNLVIEWRFANGRLDNLDGLATALVREKVEVILVSTTPATRAVQKATAEIPIVFFNVADPVASSFVASLARPGGNITGVSNGASEINVKRFELLMKIVPKMTRFAYLANPDSPMTLTSLKGIEPVAQEAGIKILVLNARTPEDIERGFLAMQRERADAAMIPLDAFINQQRGQIVALAIKHRVPTVGWDSDFAEVGGLLSYQASYSGDDGPGISRAATYVVKILKGAKPGELPVEQPTSYELAVNMKTARLLGITIPADILSRADKVLE
jgi:putative ABC transport system substrate-binding protein